MLDCYRKADPRSSPQLAVPVTLVEHLLKQNEQLKAAGHRCPKREATADLINDGFYYLLRGGEYSKTNNPGGNTIPFSVRDMTFRNSQGRLVPLTSSLRALLAAKEATMRIPNQKNGVKGQCITQQCTGTPWSPVKSLARRVHHILSNGGTFNTPIYAYKDPTYWSWRYIDTRHINTTLKEAAGAVGLYDLGYTPADISSHSLRAGGAMAMHLNGVDSLTIQKQGRWKSRTFLNYIHEQISAFAAGLSVKMSNAIPFRQIAGPSVHA